MRILENAQFDGPMDDRGLPDGFGKLTFKGMTSNHLAVESVEGQFKNGRPVGKITVRFKDRGYGPDRDGVYVGEVDSSFAPTGKGVYTTAIGNKYSGIFAVDPDRFWRKGGRSVRQRLDFRGTIRHYDEDYFAEGNFKDGLPFGDVTIKFDDKEFTGTFKASGEPKEIDGRITFADGRIYRGDMTADTFLRAPVIYGVGTMTYPNGTSRRGRYFDDGTLAPEAPIVAKPHWINFVGPAIGAALATAAGVALVDFSDQPVQLNLFSAACWLTACGFVLLITWRLLVQRFNRLEVTDTHIVHKKGVFANREREIPLGTLLSSELRQGLLGRILNYGTIEITHDGEVKAVASRIRNPTRFRDAARGDR